MSDAGALVDAAYLELVARMIESTKLRSYERLCISAGQRVLDAGCGPATDTPALARRVGPQGHVCGVDLDPQMIADAKQRAVAAGVQAQVSHLVADVDALPFADQSFDGSRAERLFLHLHDPAAALAELVRVTRRGGWVVVLEPDWGTLSMDGGDTGLERRLVREIAERSMVNGYAGRQLRGRFHAAGLIDTAVEAYAHVFTSYALARRLGQLDRVEALAMSSGAMSAEEVQYLRAGFEAADAAGRFCCCCTHMLASGRRP